MTTGTVSYAHLVDKKAFLSERGVEEPYEVTVMRASAMGILVKPKGSSTPKLVLADDVIDVEEIASTPSTLRQRALDPIAVGKARRHLLDYHGISLSQINEITEDQAVAQHEKLPHSDAGHHHNGRKNAEGEAGAEAGTESTDDE